MKRAPHHSLARAVALGRRAAEDGFDWPDVDGVLDKVDEERGELRAALGDGDRTAAAAELGDLLFVLANLARHLDIDPDAALAGAADRFEARIRHMDESIRAEGLRWDQLPLAELEARWQRAKRARD